MNESLLIGFIMVKLIHSDLNFRFNIDIVFMINYFLVGGDVPVDSETFLVTDFVNLKIKTTQYFRVAHKIRMCVHIFIEVDMSIYVLYYIFF
jgi:hypothetical protein